MSERGDCGGDADLIGEAEISHSSPDRTLSQGEMANHWQTLLHIRSSLCFILPFLGGFLRHKLWHVMG